MTSRSIHGVLQMTHRTAPCTPRPGVQRGIEEHRILYESITNLRFKTIMFVNWMLLTAINSQIPKFYVTKSEVITMPKHPTMLNLCSYYSRVLDSCADWEELNLKKKLTENTPHKVQYLLQEHSQPLHLISSRLLQAYHYSWQKAFQHNWSGRKQNPSQLHANVHIKCRSKETTLYRSTSFSGS